MANVHDVAQLQIYTIPLNFKWIKSIQQFHRYTLWLMGKPIWVKWVTMYKPIWVKWQITMMLHNNKSSQFGPSTLAVPEQLSNGGGENVGHSPTESGTDFWALCTTSATLWPLAKPLLNTGHTYCMSPVFDCSWYIKHCLLAFYLERVNSMATNRFADIIMFDKNT